MVGGIIGSGIFLTTGTIASFLPTPYWILVVWTAGGLITLGAALCYGELAAALPEAGGQYVYLRRAYGDLVGFLYGWILFLVIQTGTIAAIAAGFAEYFGYLFPAFATTRPLVRVAVGGLSHTITWGQAVAAAVTLLLSAVNYFGLRRGSWVQNLSTVAKIVALAAFVVGGFLSRAGNWSYLGAAQASPPTGLISAFGVALISVFWTFDGWVYVTYTAGETVAPERNVPRALTVGVAIVTAIYLLANLVYLYAAPVSELAGVTRVAELAATRLFGAAATSALAALIALSCFGAMNAAILSGPRVYYAMARDGLFFRALARVHPNYYTPSLAIVAQALWAALLALSGTFDQLLTYAMFLAIASYGTTVAAIFVLRTKEPDLNRPYRVPAYPYLPAAYVFLTAWFVWNTLVERPRESGLGLLILLAGLPAYWFWHGRRARRV